jgi:hypothetical protein
MALSFLKDLSTLSIVPNHRVYEVPKGYVVERTGARVTTATVHPFIKEVCAKIYNGFKFSADNSSVCSYRQFPAGRCPFAVSNPDKGGFLCLISLPREEEIHAKKLKSSTKAALEASMLEVIAFWHRQEILNDHLRLAFETKEQYEIIQLLSAQEQNVIVTKKDSMLFRCTFDKSFLNKPEAMLSGGDSFYLYEFLMIPGT